MQWLLFGLAEGLGRDVSGLRSQPKYQILCHSNEQKVLRVPSPPDGEQVWLLLEGEDAYFEISKRFPMWAKSEISMLIIVLPLS
jgi:hypothetical protein